MVMDAAIKDDETLVKRINIKLIRKLILLANTK